METKKIPHGVITKAANKLGLHPNYVSKAVKGTLPLTKHTSNILTVIEECIKEDEARKNEIIEQRAELLRKYAN